MSTTIDFDPTTEGTTATGVTVDRIKANGGNVVARVTEVITDRGSRTLAQTDHLVAEMDRLTELLVNGALTQKGLDGLLTKQPLALTGSSTGSPVALENSDPEVEAIVAKVREGLTSVSDKDRHAMAERLGKAFKGESTEIDDLRKQLSDLQKANTEVQPVIDELAKVRDPKVKSTRLDAAVAAAKGTPATASVVGVPQDQHDKVVAERDAAVSALAPANHALDDNAAFFANLLKGFTIHGRREGKELVRFDDKKVSPETKKIIVDQKKAELETP